MRKTIKEISEITGIRANTLRVYLSRPEFNRFRRYGNLKDKSCTCFLFDKYFLMHLEDILTIKLRPEAIEKAWEYYDKEGYEWMIGY